MSKVFLGVHIVFATKHRRRTIAYDHRRLLYAYIHEILNSRKCHTLRINGMLDHIHIAINLHPEESLANLVRDIKRQSSTWLSNDPRFPKFEGWGKGYYASTFSYDDRDGVIEYIRNQETHHQTREFLAEMEWFAMKAGLTWHNDDWEG